MKSQNNYSFTITLPLFFKEMYHKKTIRISTPEAYIPIILNWAESNFSVICYLNSNPNDCKSFVRKNERKGYKNLLAVGTAQELLPAVSANFPRLKKFYEQVKSELVHGADRTGIFGFLSYDLKNEVENLFSGHPDSIEMPLMHFFVPKHFFVFRGNELVVHTSDSGFDFEKILEKTEDRKPGRKADFLIKPRISKKQYIAKVNKLKQHIQRGDIYEVNFCQEFFSENRIINPVETYLRLNEISPMPFSCFYKLGKKYLLCSSPERFLNKTGDKIISQPIKGTIRRGESEKEDKLQMKKLLESKKEMSENVMIVDLVRNDLSRFSVPGTVRVEELFELHSYKHLHQMVSTLSGVMDKKYHFMDAIKNCFPMGSMTGAPKVKAMELIEKFESAKRGLFSGAVGYITPDGDFDFNVVIRSILYNAEKKYVSVMAGSAITAGCEAEKEYEECLLKAEPMLKALKSNNEQ